MNTTKIISVLTALVLMMCLFAGCSPNSANSSSMQTDSQDSQSGDGSTNVSDDTSASKATDTTGSGKVLVVYYSASGMTERVAKTVADTLGADIFHIIPTEIYSSADLDWRDSNSRVSKEHDNESLRDVPLKTTTVENWDSYDTVLIGYPIWWGIAAWPVNNFIKNNDFTGKTAIPFCTSSSSSLGESGDLLAQMAGTGDWQEGQRFQSSASDSSVSEWANGLNLK